MIVRRRSPITGEVNDLDLPITDAQYLSWKNGVMIQNAFPNLNADQREFLKTGVYPGEWNVIFAKHKTDAEV